MHIDFVRHGESVANAEGWTAGARDVALTESGRAHAKKLAAALHDQRVTYDYIVSSHLSRAIETAEIIAQAVGYTEPIAQLPGFGERYHGTMEGLATEVADNATTEQCMLAGQETVEAMYIRVQEALDVATKEAYEKGAKHMLIVAHAGVYRILKLIFEDVPLDEYVKIKRIRNTTIERLI